MIKLLKKIYWFIAFNLRHKPKWILRILKNPQKYCYHESYFPEKKSKSFNKILLEQLLQVIKYGEPNIFYFPYGHDVKTKAEINKYFHYAPFLKLRNKLNSSAETSSTFILRDKFFFEIFVEMVGVKSGVNVGVLSNGFVFDIKKKSYIKVEEFLATLNGDYFVKLANGECGYGIFHIKVNDGIVLYKNKKISVGEFNSLLGNARYIIQNKIEQHPQMASLHKQSLNTLRLITIRDISSGEIVVFPSILRIGTGESVVDNTSQGGIAVGINIDSGRLKEYGFYKPEFGSRISEHPDSHIKLSDFTIPYINEAKYQAILLHSLLPGIHSIGWDIAITADGPIFVEGNDNWEINGPQICNGPLKEKFMTLATKSDLS